MNGSDRRRSTSAGSSCAAASGPRRGSRCRPCTPARPRRPRLAGDRTRAARRPVTGPSCRTSPVGLEHRLRRPVASDVGPERREVRRREPDARAAGVAQEELHLLALLLELRPEERSSSRGADQPGRRGPCRPASSDHGREVGLLLGHRRRCTLTPGPLEALRPRRRAACRTPTGRRRTSTDFTFSLDHEVRGRSAWMLSGAAIRRNVGIFPFVRSSWSPRPRRTACPPS